MLFLFHFILIFFFVKENKRWKAWRIKRKRKMKTNKCYKISLRNSFVFSFHYFSFLWSYCQAIFPEVINLGRIVKKKGKGRPRDLWKGIHLPQTSHFLSSRFLIQLLASNWESWRKCPVEDWMLLGRLVPQQ